jgi:drug/metabolite transporter (DMT)-like permease
MSRFIASICLSAGISFLFAMVPFWTHGLSVQQATTASVVIFPVVFAAFSSYAFWREERHKRQWRERNEGKSPVAPD